MSGRCGVYGYSKSCLWCLLLLISIVTLLSLSPPCLFHLATLLSCHTHHLALITSSSPVPLSSVKHLWYSYLFVTSLISSSFLVSYKTLSSFPPYHLHHFAVFRNSSLPPLPHALGGRCCIRSLVAPLPRSMTPRPRPLVPYGLIKVAASLTRR